MSWLRGYAFALLVVCTAGCSHKNDKDAVNEQKREASSPDAGKMTTTPIMAWDASVATDPIEDAQVTSDASKPAKQSDAGAAELCDDGLDNDEDSNVDEGCGCGSSAMQDCYGGPVEFAGVGRCTLGTQSCQSSSEFPLWGVCEDWVSPTSEQCNDEDDDCDGEVDEGSCGCEEDARRDCYSGPKGTKGVGICQAGTQRCVSGEWGACRNEVLPQDEQCDDSDDDCNGEVDDGLDCSMAPPAPGNDIVVFNDINVFDDGALAFSDNVLLVQNLVNYTSTGPRGSATLVWMDYGHNSQCYGGGSGPCNATQMATMYSTISNAGYVIAQQTNYAAIPNNVKVIFLWNPRTAYTLDEINMYKMFAADGGRLIFIGEHSGYYTAIPVENDFLLNMGAIMTNTGGYLDCGYTDLTMLSLRPHQITSGLTGVRISCASVITLGPSDYPLFYDSTNLNVLAGVAKIDTTPSTMLLSSTTL